MTSLVRDGTPSTIVPLASQAPTTWTARGTDLATIRAARRTMHNTTMVSTGTPKRDMLRLRHDQRLRTNLILVNYAASMWMAQTFLPQVQT